MKNEEKELCSRCHKDLNEAPNKGGCECCREHSNQIMVPVDRIPDPDNDYNAELGDYDLITKEEVARY